MDSRTARWLSPAVAMAVALATVGAGTAVLLMRRDRLPARIVTHWGRSGQPDGFGSLTSVLVMGATLVIGLTVLIVALTLPTRQPAAAAVGSGAAVFLGVLLYGSAASQADADAQSVAAMPNTLIAIGLGLGVVVGAAQALAVRTKPGMASYPRPPAPGGAVRAHATGRLSWSGPMRHSAVTAAIPGLSVGVLVVVAIWMWRIGGPWWLMLGLAVLVVALTVPIQLATVVVDSSGVVVRVLGRPIFTTELSRIRSARAEDVRALGGYGGVGYRVGTDGSQGFITASGQALRLERFDVSDLVFTIDGAAQAAAVVNTLIDRQADSER